jgi:hypothetical protein
MEKNFNNFYIQRVKLWALFSTMALLLFSDGAYGKTVLVSE